MNTIDLCLLMISVNKNIEHVHQHHQKGVEPGRQRAAEHAHHKAREVHHTEFWTPGSRSFGGGRMGGGSQSRRQVVRRNVDYSYTSLKRPRSIRAGLQEK